MVFRQLFLSVVLLCSLSCSRSTVAPDLDLQSEDYARARGSFRTRLLQQGPAPQPAEPFAQPPDARWVSYSKSLPLKALVGPLPTDGKKHPAVLFLHGGFAMDASDWEASQPYRDAGFIVMTPLLRGENGQPGSYSLFYDEVTDVLDATETLAKLPQVDKDHLYLAGHSVGGTLTLLTALTTNRFRAATAFSGACDVATWSADQQEIIPFNPKDTKELRMRSAVAYATSFKCPTRIFYGSSETLFAPMSQETARRAKTKKLDVEAQALPGDHFSALNLEIATSIAFFQKH